VLPDICLHTFEQTASLRIADKAKTHSHKRRLVELVFHDILQNPLVVVAGFKHY
jgi:hypothetical protein